MNRTQQKTERVKRRQEEQNKDGKGEGLAQGERLQRRPNGDVGAGTMKRKQVHCLGNKKGEWETRRVKKE